MTPDDRSYLGRHEASSFAREGWNTDEVTDEVTDYGPRKRPGLTFLGFLVTLALFVSVERASEHGWFAGLGWRGGEYAYLFIGVVLGSLVVGGVIRGALARSSWRSLGSGMLIGGTIGLAGLVVFTIAISSARITF